MKEVARKEIICIIYHVAASDWVSLIHCVPNKGEFTVVPNELAPTRTIVGRRMFIDFRKLNREIRKHHSPCPFIDQTLERLAKQSCFRYLDGYSDFSQISIHPKDQPKTNFTRPFGLYAYHHMSFGLCNTHATFMTAIFADFVENIMEVFMDDFFVYRTSFNHWLNNLNKVMQ